MIAGPSLVTYGLTVSWNGMTAQCRLTENLPQSIGCQKTSLRQSLGSLNACEARRPAIRLGSLAWCWAERDGSRFSTVAFFCPGQPQQGSVTERVASKPRELTIRRSPYLLSVLFHGTALKLTFCCAPARVPIGERDDQDQRDHQDQWRLRRCRFRYRRFEKRTVKIKLCNSI